MKHLVGLLSLLASIIFLSSCNGGSGFFSASGATNEVMVIMDDSSWEGTSGRALFDVLNSNTKGLPQPEPNFRILHITPENFTSTFKMARNIIIPVISEMYSQPKLEAELDTYANGQVIMNIKAPDSISFAEYVTENKDVIINYFIEKELERNAKWLKSEIKIPVVRAQQMFGINIHFPKGLSNYEEFNNFLWATNNAGRGRQDIVIYQFPYTSETIFEKDSLIKVRNEVLGKYIKGSFDSQMSTSTAYPPDYRRFVVDGVFRAELRGLWEMTTDMMGGPFVMHAFVNENTGMVIVVETYVYAPESNKRNLMRNLEATLYTISLPKPEEAIIEG
ncbi:MAG: DUF4837 family protein [Lascolabacillus sp.]|jgi:hypothetical protein|uniref:DUF4837 family protein n=1 Tax=Lascolabacillus sp. TaxID=1924068 RepID=UPI00258A5DD4|nr:DUF4837 family protein [Lascolabacillus sp.]MDD4757944.1 DUF4837 family protein [Lascolabacillus sp.]